MKETNIFLPGMGATIKNLERISSLQALQSLFTGSTTVSLASGLDRLCKLLIFVYRFSTFSLDWSSHILGNMSAEPTQAPMQTSEKGVVNLGNFQRGCQS